MVKNASNQKRTTLYTIKNLLLPQLSASEIFFAIFSVLPRRGFEPGTFGLEVKCSTNYSTGEKEFLAENLGISSSK